MRTPRIDIVELRGLGGDALQSIFGIWKGSGLLDRWSVSEKVLASCEQKP